MVEAVGKGASSIESSFELPPAQASPWAERFASHAQVTERERDVLGVLLSGSTVPDGARRLGLATSTVRMHVKNLHSKSGTNNLHSLAVWALTHHACCWGA